MFCDESQYLHLIPKIFKTMKFTSSSAKKFVNVTKKYLGQIEKEIYQGGDCGSTSTSLAQAGRVASTNRP